MAGGDIGEFIQKVGSMCAFGLVGTKTKQRGWALNSRYKSGAGADDRCFGNTLATRMKEIKRVGVHAFKQQAAGERSFHQARRTHGQQQAAAADAVPGQLQLAVHLE